MKVKLEIDIHEADVIFKALNVIDPTSIFLKSLKDKIANAAQAVVKESKENEKTDISKPDSGK